MDYRRIVSYIYYYDKGEKDKNVGYAKIEQRGENLRVYINLNEGRKYNIYQVYFYWYEEGQMKGIKAGELTIEDGLGELKTVTKTKQLFDSNVALEQICGIILFYKEEDSFGSEWDDVPIDMGRFYQQVILGVGQEEESQLKAEEIESDIEEEAEVIEEENMSEIEETEEIEEDLGAKEEIASEKKEEAKEEVHLQEDEITPMKFETDGREKIAHMMKNFPKLPHFKNNEIIESVRIEPQDIGRLDVRNWVLANNSFLIHGYYNYRYLMVGKVRKEENENETVYVIGVPGVYYNKEKYIANLFGFYRFIPVRKNQVKTGEFGYWVTQLI